MMRTTRSRAVRVLAQVAVACGVAAGGVVALSSPAAASLGNCSNWYGGTHTTGNLVCYTGNGTYRVRVTCDNENPFGSDYYKYGAWESVGNTSIAACSNGDYAYNLYMQLISQL